MINLQKPLPSHMLAVRNKLPEKPPRIELIGQCVHLKPLEIARDATPLFKMSNGSVIRLGNRSIDNYDAEELIWRYMFDGPFKDIQEFTNSLLSQINASNGLCFCIFDKVTNHQVGVANMMNNVPAHLKIELGGIWYSPIVQRTLANTEATYLMLKYAFGLGYRRLEWKCHSQNERSSKAAIKMGFKFEGIQESHMIVKNRNRDTAWYRILDNEWPEVKQNLEKLLYQK